MDTAQLITKSHLNDDPVQGSGGGSHAGMREVGTWVWGGEKKTQKEEKETKNKKEG